MIVKHQPGKLLAVFFQAVPQQNREAKNVIRGRHQLLEDGV